MAHAFENAQIDAVDISTQALAVAHKNVQNYGLEQKIDLIESDLFSALHGKHYDLIISNPPYVNAESMTELPRSTGMSQKMHWQADWMDWMQRAKFCNTLPGT